ncbi:hypothetical protein [Halorientalis marina]|jgi:hypothetical protein|uniref:hypothetical protein n=1 Tax=Halorientalis marina TaxID=2931976 RepID=UPI001FF0F0A2|nr:hypothetical protein [Halorientalis marina]
MSLYEDRFDTDWDTLDREEAMERAFALGVAAALGERNEEEFEAVHETMGSNYDASIVELAYQEGKNEATKGQREIDGDDADVFEFVVNEELEDVEQPDRDDGDGDDEPAERATDLPSAVNETEATDPPDLDPEQTEYPDFLE